MGFVGTGTMGRPIAERLLGGGHQLTVYDAVAGSAAGLIEAGAAQAATLPQLAQEADVIFLSLPGPAQIAEVVSGVDGLRQHAGEGTVIVDLSTNSLDLARHLAAQCADAGLIYVDAPVSGGVVGARAGTLSVLVGIDDEAAWARIEPLLGCFGKKIVRAGPVGSGTLLKLINNQIFLCASVLIQEGFVLGARAGMNSEDLMNVLNESSAAVYTRKSGFVLDRNFDAELFKLSIAAKDVDLAMESAKALGVSMPMTEAAQGVYRQALELGLGDCVFHATIRALEERAGVEVSELGSKR